MPAIARLGDRCGGIIIATAVTCRVDGLPVARVGDMVTPHGKHKHAHARLIMGSSVFRVGGIPVCRVGDVASCGHKISSGSLTHNSA